MRGEVVALEAIGDSILAATFPEKQSPPTEAADGGTEQQTVAAAPTPDSSKVSNRLKNALDDGTIFLSHLQQAGAAMPCLLERRELYRMTVRNALPTDEATLTKERVRSALRQGSAAVLSTRYSPSDRVGVLFGFGFSVLGKDDATRYKVISRTEGESDTPVTKQYIVKESESQSIPVATTGIAVRFRDRDSNRRWRFRGSGTDPGEVIGNNVVWLVDHLIPTTVFGSVQFGDNDVEGIVNGTALGLGWRVVGDVNILVGLSISRTPTLRGDLETAFRASPIEGILPLPAGETEETIVGTQSEQGFLFALAMPVSLKPVFGGR
jgi:hypothetical protein